MDGKFVEFAFEALRFDADGAPRPGCPLDDPAYRGAEILIAGANFGCGSSRETAVWAVKGLGFKAVIGGGGWFDEFIREVKRRGPDSAPDFITVDSADGGTGAAPMPLIDSVGLPLRESLPAVVDALIAWDLRARVKVIASGKLVTPTAVAWALCTGADFVNSARGFMFALGCIQALQCNRNTCPTGITTHDPKLQKGLDPEAKAERVANYVKNLAYEVGLIAHACGVHNPRQLRREHARVVQDNGLSVPLDVLHPPVATRDGELRHGH